MNSQSFSPKPVKLSWKCKQCRHYNSAHSSKCSSCIKYSGINSDHNTSNNNDSGNCLDNRSPLQHSITPVEEVESGLMVDNSIYFLENRCHLSPKRQGPFSFAAGHSPSKVSKSKEENNLNKKLLNKDVLNNTEPSKVTFSTCKKCSTKLLSSYSDYCDVCEPSKSRNHNHNRLNSLNSSPNTDQPNLRHKFNFMERSPSGLRKIVFEDLPYFNLNSIAKFVSNKIADSRAAFSTESSKVNPRDYKVRNMFHSLVDSSGNKCTSPVERDDLSGEEISLSEMWTCSKCSFGYNPSWCLLCDMCHSSKKADFKMEDILNQDLEGDFQILPQSSNKLKASKAVSEQSWKCVKCTLINPGNENACKACGGSRLKSIGSTASATLKKGEYWVCVVCTLKNSISARRCKACRAKVDGSGGTKEKLNPVLKEEHFHSQTNIADEKVIKEEEEKSNNIAKVMPPDSHMSFKSSGGRHGEIAQNETSQESKGAIPKSVSVPHSASQLTTSIIPPSASFCHGAGSSSKYAERKFLIHTSSPSSHWRCSACTFDNSPTAISCKMCGSLPSVEELLSNTSRPRTGGQSELMDVLREIEEQEALDRWKKIVSYCREVCILHSYCNFSLDSN